MSTLGRSMLLYCLGALASATAATFEFRFVDGPGEGFNDPAPYTPVGGNNATTLGQARQNLMVEAGRIWGALLTSTVPIIVEASFNPQDCSGTTGTLASAGPRTYFRDFSDDLSPDIFFASALADSLAGSDLMLDTANPNNPDIRVTFNISIDADPLCLQGNGPRGPGFYYGFDHNYGARFDALSVALHELGHGLGFSSEINRTDGMGFNSSDGVARFSSFVMKIFDEQLGRAWPMLSAMERITSVTQTGALAWDGANVNRQLEMFTRGMTSQGRLRLNAPATASASSVSHWDSFVERDILMEPNISFDLVNSFVDVTACALQDIGWAITAGACPNNPPLRGLPPRADSVALSTQEDTPVTFQLKATDPEGGELIYSIFIRPAHGVLSGVPGTVTYTPVPDASGSDMFFFTVSDGTNISEPASASIFIEPINDVPVATSFATSVVSGQSIPLGLEAIDADRFDVLTIEIINNPRAGTLTGTPPRVTYRSNAGFVGSDSFTFVARDATTTSAVATVTLNVTAMVGAPAPGNGAARGGGGGGGAMNELLLLALALVVLAARLYKRRAVSQRTR